VEEGIITIKEAAMKLHINYSTAKHIVKVYKKTGQSQTNKRVPERDTRDIE
jgi:transposase